MLKIVKQTLKNFQRDKAARMGAETAYYAIFSLAPLLLVVISLAGIFLNRNQIEGTVYTQLESLVGSEGVEIARSMVDAANSNESGIVGIVMGVILLLLGATGVMSALQNSMNTIWHVELLPKQASILTTLKKRLLSFGLVLSIGFLLVISLLASSLIYGLSEQLAGIFTLPEPIIYTLDVTANLVLVTGFFTLLIKYLPEIKMPWKLALIGGIFTTLLFFIGKYLIALYLGRLAESSAYGVATSLILILLWVNYSAQILFLGVEFTKAWVKHFRVKVVPKPYARFQRSFRFQLVPPQAVSIFTKVRIMTKFARFELRAVRKALRLKKRFTRKQPQINAAHTKKRVQINRMQPHDR